MPRELKRVLIDELKGTILLHVPGKRRPASRIAIGKVVQDFRGTAGGIAKENVKMREVRKPETTTTISFSNASAAQNAVSEGFRVIGRNGLNAEIYQGSHKRTVNQVVVNFFDLMQAQRWENAIQRRRYVKLLSTRFKKRANSDKLKR